MWKLALLCSFLFSFEIKVSAQDQRHLEDRTLFRIEDKAYLFSETLKFGQELEKFHCALGNQGVMISFLTLTKNDFRSWSKLKVSQVDKSYQPFFEKVVFAKKLLSYVGTQRIVVTEDVWRLARTALKNCSVVLEKDWKSIWGEYLRAELFVKSFRQRESQGQRSNWKKQLRSLVSNRYSHKWMGPFRENL